MLTCRCAINLGVRAGILVLLGWAGKSFLALPTIHAQADSSLRPMAPPSVAKSATVKPAVRALYGKHCAKCHGADGKGKTARDLFPEIPDFTRSSWNRGRSDAHLLASILDGKGTGMPALSGKINKSEARDLAAYVRTFAPATKKARQDKQEKPALDHFDVRYRSLQKELGELQRQFDELSRTSQDQQGSKKPVSSKPSPPAKPTESSPTATRSTPVGPAATDAPAEGEVYRRYCAKCHGNDGSGNRVRRRQPEIPDFTDPQWQDRRTDSQLLAGIRDGKGKRMPPWHGKISTEEARALVAEVRAFVSTSRTKGKEEREESRPSSSSEEQSEEPAPSESAEARPPGCFSRKLIGWLGRFHPASVHFPIAMLAAAAVAELLRLATGQPAFDAVTRYCLWFGTLTAVSAGVLGWCLGEFRLTDDSWIMTTHRWLGSSTVMSAVLALGLSQGSRGPKRRRTRMCFRAALLVMAGLVLATGFFGGAAVYGLDHYTWPQ